MSGSSRGGRWELESLENCDGSEQSLASPEFGGGRDGKRIDERKIPERSAPPAPDGGLVAWLQVFGAFWLWFNTWGLANAFGVFETYYQQQYPNEQGNIIALVGSTQPFVAVLGSFLAGPLWDAGYGKALLAGGTVITSFAYFMTSITTQFWQVALTQGVLAGVGSCLNFTVAVSVIPQYFTTKKALANGVAAAGSGLGGVIYPIAFRQLQKHLTFGWSVRVLAFMILATNAIPLALVSLRVKPTVRRKIQFDLRPLYLEPAYGIYTIALGFTMAAQYTPAFFIQDYAQQNKIMSAELASYLLPVLNASSIIGRVAPNVVADRIGGLNVLCPSSLAACIVTYAWMACSTVAGCFVFAILYGLFVGTMLSLPNFVIATLCPDPALMGSRQGLSMTVASSGLLLGPPVAATILQKTGHWLGLQVFAGSMLAIASVSVLVARLYVTGWHLMRKA